MDCSSPGSSDRGILQARILKWVAIPFSRGPSGPRDQTESPALQADSLPSEPLEKPHIYLLIYFWLLGLSLAAVSGGGSLVVVGRLLIMATSLVVEHDLWSAWASAVHLSDSGVQGVVVEHGLSCSMAYRISPDQGLNQCPLHWQSDC